MVLLHTFRSRSRSCRDDASHSRWTSPAFARCFRSYGGPARNHPVHKVERCDQATGHYWVMCTAPIPLVSIPPSPAFLQAVILVSWSCFASDSGIASEWTAVSSGKRKHGGLIDHHIYIHVYVAQRVLQSGACGILKRRSAFYADCCPVLHVVIPPSSSSTTVLRSGYVVSLRALDSCLWVGISDVPGG